MLGFAVLLEVGEEGVANVVLREGTRMQRDCVEDAGEFRQIFTNRFVGIEGIR